MHGRRPGGQRSRRLAALALPWALAGCSLYPEAAPEPRYFQPLLSTEVAVTSEPAHEVDKLNLRLRRIEAAQHLTDRIAWRRGLEHGYHVGWRWTDAPDAFLGRALARSLFMSGRFRRSRERSTPTLDVRLLAFEEDVTGEPWALVEAHALVEDSTGRVLFERWLQITASIEDPSPEALAASLGQALMTAVDELARHLQEELGT